MLEICALASGSNGNCYYIGNKSDAILIDAGISCKQILTRLEEKKLESEKIKAVFISHEHSDHIRGARVFSKKMNVPIFLTPITYNSTYKKMRPAYPKFFNPGQVIEVGDFNVISFNKNHDAAEPCSFRIKYHDKNVGVLTDIGEPCKNVVSNLELCDALFLETNYDEEMLKNGSYPFFLKQRVASSQGHLSNMQAFNLLKKSAGEKLKCVFLSHISADNNTPELALSTLMPLRSKFDIKLTSRKGPAEIYSF